MMTSFYESEIEKKYKDIYHNFSSLEMTVGFEVIKIQREMGLKQIKKTCFPERLI